MFGISDVEKRLAGWLVRWMDGWMDGPTHRMVDSPHHHAEERVAGAEQLHLLGHEVFLLCLRLTRDGRDDSTRRSHLFMPQ